MQLEMDTEEEQFDRNAMRKVLEDANKRILDLLTLFDVPDSIEDEDLEDSYLLEGKKSKDPSASKNGIKTGVEKRALSADELQERLEIMKNKMTAKKSKMSDRTAKKRQLKRLKKEGGLKKTLVSVKKSFKNEKMKELKATDAEDVKEDFKPPKPMKPIFNEEGKIVFSKFDFAAHPGAKVKKSKKERYEKNPKKILDSMKQEKKKISELIEQGAEDKVKELQEEKAWKKVFDKVEGKKIKDDPTLLQKSIKKRKTQKKKSKGDWIERKKKVEHDIASRQKKRQENINKKLKDKKTKKMKRLAKRGKIIPGF